MVCRLGGETGRLRLHAGLGEVHNFDSSLSESAEYRSVTMRDLKVAGTYVRICADVVADS